MSATIINNGPIGIQDDIAAPDMYLYKFSADGQQGSVIALVAEATAEQWEVAYKDHMLSQDPSYVVTPREWLATQFDGKQYIVEEFNKFVEKIEKEKFVETVKTSMPVPPVAPSQTATNPVSPVSEDHVNELLKSAYATDMIKGRVSKIALGAVLALPAILTLVFALTTSMQPSAILQLLAGSYMVLLMVGPAIKRAIETKLFSAVTAELWTETRTAMSAVFILVLSLASAFMLESAALFAVWTILITLMVSAVVIRNAITHVEVEKLKDVKVIDVTTK